MVQVPLGLKEFVLWHLDKLDSQHELRSTLFNKNKRQRLCLTALCRYAIGRQQRFIMFSVFKFIICSHKMAVCLHTSVAIDLLGFSVGLVFVVLLVCFLLSMIYTPTVLTGAIQPVLAVHTSSIKPDLAALLS